MKISTEQIEYGNDEIIVRYKQMTHEISDTIKYLQGKELQIVGSLAQTQHLLYPSNIYYFESVDNIVFAYTNEAEYQTSYTLSEINDKLLELGFFRCNKSFVINVNKIVSLKSNVGNRIDAALENGEHIIISRHYAKAFRELLREGKSSE